MFRNYEQCCVIKIQVYVDDMLNITNNYTKHVMNKFCHTALLPDGCVLLQVGGKVANTNWELAAHPQQLTRYMLYV